MYVNALVRSPNPPTAPNISPKFPYVSTPPTRSSNPNPSSTLNTPRFFPTRPTQHSPCPPNRSITAPATNPPDCSITNTRWPAHTFARHSAIANASGRRLPIFFNSLGVP